MSTFIEVIKRFVRPYTTIIISVIVFIIFVIIASYAYNKFYTKPNEVKNTGFGDVANSSTDPIEIIVYFFHVDWCPHCKTALPEWNKFKNEYNN